MFKKQTRSDFDRFDGGWTDKKYNYMSWALSCLQFGKFYNNIELITDSIGKEILIDQLKLPYTKVHVLLDKLNHYHPGLWAIGKLYTYSIQTEPFLHVDGDAYIWERFSTEIENSGLVAQNLEVNFSHYRNSLEGIQNNFSYIPECLSKHNLNDDINAINAGVFGGNDIEFIQEYTKSAFKFIDKNISSLEKISIGLFNMVYEQFLFYKLVKERKKSITYVTKNTTDEFEGLAEFSGVSKITKFIHVVGKYKYFSQTGENIARHLLLDYPEYYFRIEGLLKKLLI